MRFGARLKPLMTAKIVTLFVALTGFADSIWAGPTLLCSEVLGDSKASRLVLEEGTPRHFSEASLLQHLGAIDKILGPLSPPAEVRITVGPRAENSVFDRATYKLYAGLKEDPRQIATLTHEYGHAILEKNLELNSEIYRQFKPSVISLAADRLANKPGVTRTQKLYLLTVGLHEFFADVVAVTFHNDPQALRHIVADTKKDLSLGSWDDMSTRDFETSPNSPRLQNWETLLPFASFTGDMYYALLPARWEFWNLSKNSVSNPQTRSQILAKVYKVVEKVLEETLLWSDAQVGGKKVEPEIMKQLNQRLIEELRASL